ncbi:MAG: DUF4158 domain-containing protein [Solirubrobacteraceae bacterium]
MLVSGVVLCEAALAVPVEFLSDQQVARFGRLAADPSPVELELFFRLDAGALRRVRRKRPDESRLGFAVSWGRGDGADARNVPRRGLGGRPRRCGGTARPTCGRSLPSGFGRWRRGRGRCLTER